MGLSQWIDLQLHPERIPESAELAKLVEPLVEPKLFPLERLLTPQQIRLLRTGTAQEARDFLATLPPEKAEQVLTQMPVVRQKVGAAAAKGAGNQAGQAQAQLSAIAHAAADPTAAHRIG